MNPGHTSKELYSFNSAEDVPNDFTGICIINQEIDGYVITRECWYKDGKRHREDGPAMKYISEYMGGITEWYQNGERHRLDGPAVEHPDGRKEWWLNGLLHRLYEPAIEHADGNGKFWFINGKRHRIDGPAIEHWSGKQWYIQDELHRVDGPAIEYSDGRKYWYLNGKKYGRNNDFTNESWKQFQRTIIF